MKFSLNQFLLAVSSALDFLEIDVFGKTINHSKRVAYITLRISKMLGFNDQDIYDVVSLAIMHDNGLNKESFDSKKLKDHCIDGENNIKEYPFFEKNKNIIKYHHELYDGSGIFGLRGSEIPIMAQIISFADYLERNFIVTKISNDEKIKIQNFLNDKSGILFKKEICDAMKELIDNKSFILDLKNEFIDAAIDMYLPKFSIDISLDKISEITQIFSNIIDSKSKFTLKHSKGIAKKAGIMADYYKYDHDIKMKLVIAANLHDLGKLAVPNSILDGEKPLTKDEFEIIKAHTYYTRAALSKIDGFEEITEWAANHHEKLNGKGYPYGKIYEELDFNSRLMGCIDIYQALTEDRPYRESLSHKEALEIMNSMVKEGLIDKNIVDDINNVFKKIIS